MISFIVPAYNEERVLGATLAAVHVAAQAVDEPYELVVVDDASTDGTAQIAERGGALVCPRRSPPDSRDPKRRRAGRER